VGFDPRGVGESMPSVDCAVDQEFDGMAPRPWPVPADLDPAGVVEHAQTYVDACTAANGDILEHVSTANVARDMDALRAAVGDDELTYLGYSYGSLLGSTYAGLFPDRFRALVLDSPVAAGQYVDDPVAESTAAAAGAEDSLDRFLTACAADQSACSGFGGDDPEAAFDALVAAATETPIPADGYTADPRPVTGDDIRDVTGKLLYSKQEWGSLAGALALAAAGDGSVVRALTDEVVFQRGEDGSTDPFLDRYVAISAVDQHWPTDPAAYFERGAREWADVPHFWGRLAYAQLPFALWPHHDDDTFSGPFTVASSAPTALLVGITHDTAAPYSGAQRLVQELGNARLLTMDGDGHTAYGGNSACIDGAVEAYLIDGTLPAGGTVCAQEVPFTAPEELPAGTR
jgi:pimeloyl-ACP methyl ester carboxylesterase